MTIKFVSRLILLNFLLLMGCSKSEVNNSNPYLPNYSFTVQLDMDLPSYSNLKFAGNAVTVTQQGVGIRGIVVFNAGSNNYLAYDLACPNQAISSCSTLTISGITATCPCDNVPYSLFTGQSSLTYPLKSYRTQLNGNVIRVYN